MFDVQTLKDPLARNTLISAAVHVALILVWALFSISSCRLRRPPMEITTFVDFQPGLPAARLTLPVAVAPAPAEIPDRIPEPAWTAVKPPPAKETVEISRKLIKRSQASDPAKPVRKLSAEEIRRMLGATLPTPPAAGASGAGPVAGPEQPYAWYLALVRATMYDAWQQPSALAGKRGLVASMLIRVRQDGEIIERRLLKGSGNALMDASVLNAVESVKKLPELPFGFGGNTKDLTIDFELTDAF